MAQKGPLMKLSSQSIQIFSRKILSFSRCDYISLIIPSFRRQREIDLREPQTGLIDITSSGPARANNIVRPYHKSKTNKYQEVQNVDNLYTGHLTADDV